MMSRLLVLLSRIVGLLRRTRADAALADEVAHHLALLEERYVARGMTPDAARREARRAFGGVQQLTEEHRDIRSFVWLDHVRQDAGYALRMLRRNPGFAVVAMLTLALGIGANTAVFSVVNAVVLEPLPYPDAGRVQRVGWDWNGRGSITGALSPYKFEYLRRQNATFASLATWRVSTPDIGPRGGGPVTVLQVSEDFFSAIGTRPSTGRTFSADEQAPGGASVAILSNACWQSRFGGDAGIVGRTVLLNDRPHVVIGLMPPAFEFPEVSARADVLVPLALRADPEDLGANYPVMGRLRDGRTPADAARDIARVFERLRAAEPKQFGGADERAVLMSFNELYLGGVEQPLWILLGGVSLVLLIACANVASLIMARASARVREMAVRTALGASRARILRQAMTEGFVLVSLGGVLGVLTGVVLLRALADLAPAGIPRMDQVRVDVAVLMIMTSVVLLTGLAFGVASSLAGSSGDPGRHATTGRQGSAVTRSGRRVRQVLIAGEATLAMVLLAGAVLLAFEFHRLTQVELGFDPRGVTVVSFRRVPPAYRSEARVRAFERELTRRIDQLPGVSAVASTSMAPLGERGANMPMTVDGRPDATEGAVEWRAVSRAYADVMGLRVVRGRWLEDSDFDAARPVIVISASTAARYWPDADPIGQRILLGVFRGEPRTGSSPVASEVVGVVDDVRELGPVRPPRRMVFVPQDGTSGLPMFLIRSAAALGPDLVSDVIRRIDPQLPEPVVSTFDQRLGARLSRDRFASLVIGLFAMVALALTAIGVYGVVSWVVRQSTQEIGIRMALGAGRADVFRSVLVRGLLPVVAGLIAGGGVSLLTTRLFAAMASIPPAAGGWVPAAAAGGLLLAASAAAWIPARRAMAVDPVIAIRAE